MAPSPRTPCSPKASCVLAVGPLPLRCPGVQRCKSDVRAALVHGHEPLAVESRLPARAKRRRPPRRTRRPLSSLLVGPPEPADCAARRRDAGGAPRAPIARGAPPACLLVLLELAPQGAALFGGGTDARRHPGPPQRHRVGLAAAPQPPLKRRCCAYPRSCESSRPYRTPLADVRPPPLRRSGATRCKDLLVVETSDQARGVLRSRGYRAVDYALVQVRRRRPKSRR
jgi:hypothetical protein